MAGLLTAIQAIVVAIIASWLGFSESSAPPNDPVESRLFLKISLEQPVKVTDPCAQPKAA